MNERNDLNALKLLRQYFEARDQVRDIREEQSARASKVHDDNRAGLIEARLVGQLVMEATEYGENQVNRASEKMEAAMNLLDAWYRDQEILSEKLST